VNHPHIGVVIPVKLRDALFHAADRARLEALGTVHWATQADKVDAAQAIELLRDCTVGVGSWNTPWPDATVLASCPSLRLWVHAAGTVKHFFGPHLAGRELTIASCKGAIAEAVAEYTLGQVILGVRGAWLDALGNRRGVRGAARATMPEATVGVIGASEVGRQVIALVRGMGATVLLADPTVDEVEASALGAVKCNSIIELCGRSDVVTLHTPLLEATRGLIDAAALSAMREGATFINTSRGGCVDEAALIAELGRGRIYACLDVTEPEPAAADSPLRKLPNVMLTSHLAGPRSITIGRQAVDDIAAWLGGGRPRHVVTDDMLATIA
jgi:phosphoglycerate dehydrogenase-like enzyme